MDSQQASVLGAGISASASHVNLLASSLWNQRMQRKGYEQNLSLQQQAQDFTTSERLAQQEWEESMYNEYMSPAAKIAQMRAAGINPNDAAAAVAGGSATMPASPSGASAGLNSAPAPPYQDLGSVANNSMLGFADALKKLAEARKINTDADNLGRKYSDEHDLSRAQIQKIISDTDLSFEQAQQLRQLTPGLVKLNKFEQQLILTQVDDLQHKISTYEHQINLLKSQAQNAEGSARNQNADAAIKEAQLGLEKARSDFKAGLYLQGVDADADWKEKLINFIASDDEGKSKLNVKDVLLRVFDAINPFSK